MKYNVSQNSIEVELGYEFENDDAAWVMACVFMIFTMQTGFGLVESGMCHQKNEGVPYMILYVCS